MHPFLHYAREKQPEIIGLIQTMVECESPTDSVVDVDRFVDLLVEHTRDIASAQTVNSEHYGRHLKLEFQLGKQKDNGQILGLGHSDTVWPLGTLQSMPWKVSDGRLWGPGVLDVKAGLAFFIYAARTLRELDVPASRPVALLVLSDEEIGSPSSRMITEAEARGSEAVLVLEPGTGLTGKLKTARKGVGRYTVDIQGKAAHAGVDFASGASAILEAAHQIQMLDRLTDFHKGTTVNPGVITGGSRANVVAAQARIEVDVRVSCLEAAKEVDNALRSMKSSNPACSVTVEGGLSRPPMERTEAIANLFAKAKAFGSELGVLLEESATGGGSDGNFTAAIGVPTLDGLGAVGEGAHANDESVLISRIADRTALLAYLLTAL